MPEESHGKEVEKSEEPSRQATREAASIPRDAREVIEQLKDAPQEVLQLFAAFFRSTTVGPDPQTAEHMAKAAIHEETTRLDGYKAHLENRDRQNERDHKFRVKQLNHLTTMRIITLIVGVAGVITGVYLLIGGHATLGSNILIASVALMIFVLGGKLPSISQSE